MCFNTPLITAGVNDSGLKIINLQFITILSEKNHIFTINEILVPETKTLYCILLRLIFFQSENFTDYFFKILKILLNI